METKPDLLFLYELMLRSRCFEEVVITLWNHGYISGEMHMSMGEEAIMAAIISQLHSDDALALDHRGTAPLLMRGIDPKLLLDEFLGLPQGLCKGRGGHMHLFSPEHLSASSGIVGASGPAGVGFGLAAKKLRPGSLAVSFFGEGSMNQGMLLESLNLAVIWSLPVIFICKDNQWSITTQSADMTGGNLLDRASSFGLTVAEIDGFNVESAWYRFREISDRTRHGKGPVFIHSNCIHLEGHFLGDQFFQTIRHPVEGMSKIAGSLMKSAMKKKSASIEEKSKTFHTMLTNIFTARKHHSRKNDPLLTIRDRLKTEPIRLTECEEKIRKEMEDLLKSTLKNLESKTKDAECGR